MSIISRLFQREDGTENPEADKAKAAPRAGTPPPVTIPHTAGTPVQTPPRGLTPSPLVVSPPAVPSLAAPIPRARELDVTERDPDGPTQKRAAPAPVVRRATRERVPLPKGGPDRAAVSGELHVRRGRDATDPDLPLPVGAFARPATPPRRDEPITPSAVEVAFDQVIESSPDPSAAEHDPQEKTSKTSRPVRPSVGRYGGGQVDAEARALFEAMLVEHMRPLRGFMLEVSVAEPPAAWLALVQPTLKTLISAAEELELADLATAASELARAFASAAATSGQALGRPARDALLDAYRPLIQLLPTVFGLEGERDRREPLLVDAIFGQVPGLEPLMCDRLRAAGLGRLDALLRARRDELMNLGGLPDDVAHGLDAALGELRQGVQVSAAKAEASSIGRIAMIASTETSILLEGLREALLAEHTAFEVASSQWTREAIDERRTRRRTRAVAWEKIVAALARLGEVDLATRLETLAFEQRLAEFDAFIRKMPRIPPAPTKRPPQGGKHHG
jgi:hypothetical protein